MILTLNYVDLQEIKIKMQENKNKSNEEIYICIENYKDTLNYMYENKLIKDISKENLETELEEFAKNMLSQSEMSYRELQRQCRTKATKSYLIKPNLIKLKL